MSEFLVLQNIYVKSQTYSRPLLFQWLCRFVVFPACVDLYHNQHLFRSPAVNLLYRSFTCYLCTSNMGKCIHLSMTDTVYCIIPRDIIKTCFYFILIIILMHNSVNYTEVKFTEECERKWVKFPSEFDVSSEVWVLKDEGLISHLWRLAAWSVDCLWLLL